MEPRENHLTTPLQIRAEPPKLVLAPEFEALIRKVVREEIEQAMEEIRKRYAWWITVGK